MDNESFIAAADALAQTAAIRAIILWDARRWESLRAYAVINATLFARVESDEIETKGGVVIRLDYPTQWDD